jgi:hypothetical protein
VKEGRGQNDRADPPAERGREVDAERFPMIPVRVAVCV